VAGSSQVDPDVNRIVTHLLLPALVQRRLELAVGHRVKIDPPQSVHHGNHLRLPLVHSALTHHLNAMEADGLEIPRTAAFTSSSSLRQARLSSSDYATRPSPSIANCGPASTKRS